MGVRVVVKRERTPKVHPAIDLASHQTRIDHATRRECTNKAGGADLTEIRIDLDLGENGAVRMHGIGCLRAWVGGALAAGIDLAQPGAAEDIRVALAAAFIIAAEEATVPRGNAGIACTEQWRPLITGREIGGFSNDNGPRLVDRHASGPR